MEITAAYEAAAAHAQPLEIVTDSTYVKNCFDNRWYVNWLRNGWRNSQRKPVANRELWEPFIDLYLARPGEIRFRWVKGHSGDPMNDLVDRLAVAACASQRPDAGAVPPDPEVLGAPDAARSRRQSGTPLATAPTPRRDPRVPDGHRLVVFGHRPPELGGYGDNPIVGGVRRLLTDIVAAKAELRPDLVVVTGLRLGAETLGAEAASAAGVPYVVVLPYPDAEKAWSETSRARFRNLVDGARTVVTLERAVPDDKADVRAALARRDGWLIANAEEALLVWDGEHRSLAQLHAKLLRRLGDDLWVVEPVG